MMDPDKKVEKIKKERPGIYQSSQHPKAFENEGEEFKDMEPQLKSPEDELRKNEQVEKSKGDQ